MLFNRVNGKCQVSGMALEKIKKIHDAVRIKLKMGVRREEYLDHMTFKSNERPLFTEIFGPLVGLKEEWIAQGATPEELDFSAFCYRNASFGRIQIDTGYLGGKELEKILEETDKHIIARDQMGRRIKLAKGVSTIALPMDYPVKNMDDWLAIKHHYEFSEKRFDENYQQIASDYLEEGKVVTVGIPGGFDEPRQLMGEERLCMAYYDEPELIHDILETIGKMTFEVINRAASNVRIDMLCIHEDMAGKGGPLIGPNLVTEFIKPYYRRVWNMLQGHGAKLFQQDSDGDINAVIPAFLDAGINFMHPFEPAAGMDIVKVRQKYGKALSIEGGIDKHVLRKSKDDIIAELEYKIPPMLKSGGCVIGLDHRIPNGTPLENYRFYIEKAWAIMESC